LKAWDAFYAGDDVNRRSEEWLASLRAKHEVAVYEEKAAAAAAYVRPEEP
jgi:hypothetical protein